jgi:putative ABC transport system permease protein
VEAVVGRSTHYISGGPGGIPEEIYVELRKAGLDIPMAPILSQLIVSPDLGEIPLQLLGVDPFAEEPFRSYLYNDESQVRLDQLGAFYVLPGAILVSQDIADRYGVAEGDIIQLNVSGQSQPGMIAGVIEPRDTLSRRALENLVIADVSTAQEISGRIGFLERIDLILPAEDQASAISTLKAFLPNGVEILPAEGRSQAVEELTAAFRTNLTALSLLGLTIGLFLIYNTMTFSVVQRRQSFGTLRALGVTGRELFILVLSEAFLVGMLGSLLGIVLGVLLGRGAVDQVSQTINDSFYTLTVREVSLPASSLIKGGLLGLAATFFAAVLPAWEAAKSPPRRILSRSQLEMLSNKILARAALVGALMAISGGLLLATIELSLGASFACIFGLTVGLALTTPWLTQQVMPMLSKGLSLFGPIGRLGPREVSGSASRTSPAMAALMVAVAVTIGASLMVSSFRGSVINWLDQILSNDIYGSVAGASLAEPAIPIDPTILERVEDWPEIEAVHLLRNVEVDSPLGPISISANNNPNDGNEQVYVARQGSGSEVWEAVQAGAVVISEPLANRLDLWMGDDLVLLTEQGEHSFPIVAVISDYTTSRGTVTMWLENYRDLWNDDSVTAFSARVAEGTDIDAIVEEMRNELNHFQFVNIRSNQALRMETLEVFDRTFLITRALQLITTGVAFVGVLSAMLSLQLEKQRQMGILKAIGLSIRQLWGLTLLETGLIGAVAGFIALPTGYLIAQILLQLINKRSFGWTLQLQLKAEPFIQAMLIAISAAILAGLYPAYRASRRSAADAIRFD